MTVDLASLLDPASSALAAGFLVFLRIGAAMALLPAFGEMVVPLRVRLAAAVAFSAIVTPAVDAQVQMALDSTSGWLVMIAGEVGAGLLLGVSLRLLVWSLHITASIAAQATSLAQLLGGASVDPQPALGLILLWGALALATAMGLHVRFVAMFIQSYQTIGPGALPSAADTVSWLMPAMSRTFEMAFLAAMPFVAASLIYNLTLGVINKAMPQLMVAFVGAPAITLGALALLWLTAPLILSIWLETLQNVSRSPFGPR